MSVRGLAAGLLAGTVLLVGASPASAATITVGTTVDDTVDNGNCTLREAIESLNAATVEDACVASGGGAIDTIDFDFSDTETISPASALPSIQAPATIEAREGVGCEGARQVVLDGSGLGAAGSGLELGATADGSEVCGFVIGDFPGTGITVRSNSSSIVGNRIGLGTGASPAAMPNEDGVLITGFADENTVGGTDPDDRNIISGNTGPVGAGVRIGVGEDNTVLGNYIGTDPGGDAVLANDYGVRISGSSNNAVGGAAAGAGNVISGNSVVGVMVEGATSTANRIEGNMIGTDPTGTIDLGNAQQGVRISDAVANVIGGDAAGEGNLISGNTLGGIQIQSGDQNQILGNLVGTNASGTAALPNNVGIEAIAVGSGAEGNAIGAPDTSADAAAPGARNLVSGNTFTGIRLVGSGTDDNLVQGNFIGTDITGTAALANGSRGVTIESSAATNRIGGGAAGAGNVISANVGTGVHVISDAGAGTGVEGNRIGTDRVGAADLGNGGAGVLVEASGTSVGGTGAGEENTIAHNAAEGVLVDFATGNGILGNSIFDNGLLGIDLENGGNASQNPPVLSGAQANSVDTTVQGTLTAAPSADYRLEYFSSPTCDASGDGEGETFLGAVDVTTGVAGIVVTDVTLPSSPVGSVVTATATRESTGNTSPFSACEIVVAKAEPPAPPDPDPPNSPDGDGGDGGDGGGGGGSGGGGGGGGPAPDTKAPLLDVGGDEKQHNKKKVKVEVACDEDCTVDGEGTIKVPEKYKDGKVKKKEKFDLKGADEVELEADETAKLKLEFKNKAADLVEKAMKKKEKSTAKVTATALDAAGNETVAEKFEIKVKK